MNFVAIIILFAISVGFFRLFWHIFSDYTSLPIFLCIILTILCTLISFIVLAIIASLIARLPSPINWILLIILGIGLLIFAWRAFD
jgi:hypothetical protein